VDGRAGEEGDGVTDLSEFLLARIAEDEEVAKRASGDRLRRMSQADDTIIADAGFMQTFTTARVLAECEAKRRVVKEHAEADPCDHAYDTSLMGSPFPTPTTQGSARNGDRDSPDAQARHRRRHRLLALRQPAHDPHVGAARIHPPIPRRSVLRTRRGRLSRLAK
jgi:hypothetical protein